MGRSDALFRDLLAPLKWPEAPLQMIRFGLSAIRSATGLARSRFRETEAQALFAGCAAHSIMDLNRSPTAALGLIFAIAGHCVEWPVIRGGTEQLAHALQRYLLTLGVDFFCDETITDAAELPEARVFMFDTSPTQMATICESVLPSGYRRRLSRYRYGPGVFKLDWALSEPIPWRDQRTASAATVHIGGRMDEIAAAEAEMWRGKHPDKPFVLLCQQSLFDDSRAPAGQHTGYAYCHVPVGSTIDQTDAIESQIERFAPGFRDTIIARNRMNTHAFERHNPNYIGGRLQVELPIFGSFLRVLSFASIPTRHPIDGSFSVRRQRLLAVVSMECVVIMPRRALPDISINGNRVHFYTVESTAQSVHQMVACSCENRGGVEWCRQ